MGRYETELEILLLALARRSEIATVPIPKIYVQHNRSSHFRPLADSTRIYRTALARRFGRSGRRRAPHSATPAPRERRRVLDRSV